MGGAFAPIAPPPPAYAPVILRFDVSILNIWYVIITYLGKYLYPTTIQPLSVLQKKPAVSIMTFSKFDKHSSPLFKKLNITKLTDLIKYHISIFMLKFHNQLLPSVFNSHFTSVENIQSYHEQQQKSVIIFQKQGLIMDCLVSDIKDLKFGI